MSRHVVALVLLLAAAVSSAVPLPLGGAVSRVSQIPTAAAR
ncbi:MAG TPA: hypothetical protein VKH82_06835 [Candidatus Binatia bacterium]|nr:hypothetical protein [Candidatus Binatia bacterium]